MQTQAHKTHLRQRAHQLARQHAATFTRLERLRAIGLDYLRDPAVIAARNRFERLNTLYWRASHKLDTAKEG